MPAPIHLISKVADPFFAVFIGLSAATLRINREEKEKGLSTQQTINSAFRYAMMIWGLDLITNEFFPRRIGFPRANDPLAKQN